MAQTLLPEQGQIVEVRRRRFAVVGVTPSIGTTEPQHLLNLISVDEDGSGEEVSVIWELEPGARVFEENLLPDPVGFDKPEQLDVFLNAIRWGTINSADLKELQAPFRSGIKIMPHQLAPVVRSLEMPRVNLLIADDVGLGKTIETGLVVQELILRGRARSMLIACPSSLQIQWQEQMRDKFGLEFRIVDSQMMKELRRKRGLHVNPWTHFPRLITSIDYIKRERPLGLMKDALPAPGEPAYPRRFDVLIIDEAHNVAPSGKGKYATDSLRTQAMRTLVPHFEHRLFLTATPHNGYRESFTALLELLDNQRFSRLVDCKSETLAYVMVRRLKSELKKQLGGALFPERKVVSLEVTYTKEENEAHELLQEYAKIRSQTADKVERTATEFVMKLLKKRLFSSPAAFRKTLAKHNDSLKTAVRGGAKSKKNLRPSEGRLRRMLEDAEEEFGDDVVYEQSQEENLETAAKLFRDLGKEEGALLKKLLKFSEKNAHKADSKAQSFLTWVKEAVRPGGKWTDERVVIFTEYRDTQNWLLNLLQQEDLLGSEKKPRTMTLYGGMDPEHRESVKGAFQTNPAISSVRILLATDAASEGLDLQNYCNRLIHYEIPWNPNRLEQRNGRLDRHGQKKDPVYIYHFVGAGYQEELEDNPDAKPGSLAGDLEFLARALGKVQTIREDLGRVGPIIAQQVEEAMQGRRQNGLNLTESKKNTREKQKLQRIEENLVKKTGEYRERLMESRRNLKIEPENVLGLVRLGLELADQPPLEEIEVDGLWPDPDGNKKNCPVFQMPELRGVWAACREGLEHPHTGKIRPIVFDQEIAGEREDVVLVHLNHRLVRMCQNLLRSEVWAAGEHRKLNRISARLIGSMDLSEPRVILYGRLVVFGGDSRRLHEEILTAGLKLKNGKYQVMTQKELDESEGFQSRKMPPKKDHKHILGEWEKLEKPLNKALQKRRETRATRIESDLTKRKEREAKDIRQVLEELRSMIQDELKEPEQPELKGLLPDEKQSQERDLDRLRKRVEEIPDEIIREEEVIGKRYSEIKSELFPVALCWLIPEG